MVPALQLSVQQDVVNPDLLMVQDVTPPYHATTAPGGYGGPNLSRDKIDHVVFTLTTDTGQVYYTRPITWRMGTLPLLASQFYPVNHVGHQLVFSLADGQYDLTYSIYAKVGIPTQTGNYHLILGLYNLEQVWVLKNGGWINLTDAGAINAAGQWEWAVFDTTDRYTQFETRIYRPLGGYDVQQRGTVDTVFGNSPTQPTKASTTPALITATTGRIVLTLRASKRMAALSQKVLNLTKGSFKNATGASVGILVMIYGANELLKDIQQAGEQPSNRLAEALADVNQRLDFLDMSVDNLELNTSHPYEARGLYGRVS